MSRSYSKYIPLWGSNWKRVSERDDKKEWHRKMRRRFAYQIFNEEDVPYVSKEDVSNRHMMRKDDGPVRVHRSLLKNVIEREYDDDLMKGYIERDSYKKATSVKYKARK